jgi:7,8-dihydro-6-hydroxymethylpterin dimethyltransferase
LNSNGIRLGEDRTYTKALAEAGLSFVFMQYDGTEDFIYAKLRGKPLLAKKKAAIKACADHMIGVTLVPTIVPGVNDRNIGEILDFGFSNSPAVRGVHFQPASYFGRYPHPLGNEDQITLPEILRAIEHQTAGKVIAADFVPSGCDHPRCGFHGDFVVLPDALIKLTSRQESCSCNPDDGNAHLKNRSFVARRWKRTIPGGREDGCCNKDYREMDNFLERIKSHGFTITAMAFQDAYNIDIERLRRCSLHVYSDDKLIPFCVRYLTTAQEGEAKHNEQYR